MRHLFLLLIIFIEAACGTVTDEIPGLQKKPLSDTVAALLNVVDDGINYMPFQSKTTEHPVNSPNEAWEALQQLYPQYKDRITCWLEYHNFFVFSINFNDPATDCRFWHILYVKKGGTEFRYFWPAT
jgi:hypothetical protein